MQKVLLIEDDPMVSRAYEKLFQLENFDFKAAINGEDGLEFVRTFKPEIILLDVMMQPMNGLGVLTSLKSGGEYMDIPVIVLTNISDERLAKTAVEKGAEVVMIKSQSEPAEVVAKVKELLGLGRQPSEPPQSPA